MNYFFRLGIVPLMSFTYTVLYAGDISFSEKELKSKEKKTQFMSSGIYVTEGMHQKNELQPTFGLRADITNVGSKIMDLESSEHLKESIKIIDQTIRIQRQNNILNELDPFNNLQVHAFQDYGDNIYFKSPLIIKMLEDAQKIQSDTGTSARYLDFGAGIGFNTQQLLEIGATVVAYDIDERNLAVIKHRMKKIGLNLDKLYLNDTAAKNLTFPDNAFDGILISHVLHYLNPEEITALVAHCYRWLKPQGRLYIQAFNILFQDIAWFQPIYLQRLRQHIKWPGSIENVRQQAADNKASQDIQESLKKLPNYFHAIESSSLLNALIAAGFNVIAHDFQNFLGDAYDYSELTFIAEPIKNPDDLWKAMKEKNSKAVQKILLADSSLISRIVSFGYTPLMMAIMHHNWDIFSWLLTSGAVVNTINPAGDTALHIAVSFNAPRMVRRLLLKGANPNIRDKQGRTPLFLAILNGYKEIAEFLIQYKADVNMPDASTHQKPITPLRLSQEINRPDLEEMLIKAGAKNQ